MRTMSPPSLRIFRCRDTRGSLCLKACARSETLSAPSVQSASSRSRLGSPAACSHFTTSANGIRFMLTIVQFFNYNPKNGL